MKTGDLGEKLVAEKMEEMGMRILDRNFHSNLGEIDIIAMDGDILVFTEVKTRYNKEYGSALEAITYGKIQKILKTGQYYMIREDLTDLQVRLDAAEVYMETKEINYIENVYPY